MRIGAHSLFSWVLHGGSGEQKAERGALDQLLGTRAGWMEGLFCYFCFVLEARTLNMRSGFLF